MAEGVWCFHVKGLASYRLSTSKVNVRAQNLGEAGPQPSLPEKGKIGGSEEYVSGERDAIIVWGRLGE